MPAGRGPRLWPAEPAAIPRRMHKLNLRPAAPADAAALVAMVDALSEGENEPRGRFTVERALADAIGPERAVQTIIAELDGRPVGYALFHDAYSTEWASRGLYLEDLFVAPAARRSGVGRALMAAVAALARRRGLSFLWWCSRPQNAAANAFYATMETLSEEILAHAMAFAEFERLAKEGAALLPDSAADEEREG